MATVPPGVSGRFPREGTMPRGQPLSPFFPVLLSPPPLHTYGDRNEREGEYREKERRKKKNIVCYSVFCRFFLHPSFPFLLHQMGSKRHFLPCFTLPSLADEPVVNPGPADGLERHDLDVALLNE